MGDFWDAAKGVLKTVAPVLGMAVGGPLGGIAARTLAGVLLGDENASEEDIAAAIAGATPDQLLAIKQADFEFQTTLKRLDIEIEQVAAGDRDSARRRQIVMKDKMPGVIAAAALSGFFGILGTMIFVELPASAQQPLSIMLGALAGLVIQIGNFYFGSSAGSSRKNDTIEKLLGERRANA